MPAVLIVDDDISLLNACTVGLKALGHSVRTAETGADAVSDAAVHRPDVIVLDLGLPDLDGLEVCRRIRGWTNTPVIILSNLGAVDARVEGLTSGANDYLVKPFAFSELLARLKLLIAKPSGGTQVETILACEDLEMNLLNRRVTRAGRRIELQPREFRLLEYLMKNAGQVVTRTMLLEHVWDYHFDPQTNVIDVHISRLRSKIDKGRATPLLRTIRGAGYMIRENGR